MPQIMTGLVLDLEQVIDFKFNFLTKKRIQPFIITSLGGSYRSIGYNSTPKYYPEGFIYKSRISSRQNYGSTERNFKRKI